MNARIRNRAAAMLAAAMLFTQPLAACAEELDNTRKLAAS